MKLLRAPRERHFERILRLACVMALVALGLMVWSLLDQRAIAVVVAMSLGQALGTLSLFLFLVVVIADLRRLHVEEAPVPNDAPPPIEERPTVG